MSVQGYRNSNRLPVCVYMYECNFRRDSSRLKMKMATHVWWFSDETREKDVFHCDIASFPSSLTRGSTLIHEFVGWKYDLVSRLSAYYGNFVAMLPFRWFALMSWRPCGRDLSFENDSLHRFLRVFTYFLVSLWIPWKIIATWFSLSLFFFSRCYNHMKIGMVGEGTLGGMREEGSEGTIKFRG